MSKRRVKISDSLLTLGVVTVAHLVFSNKITLFLVGAFVVYMLYTIALAMLDE